MSYLSFSRRWASYLSRQTDLPAEQETILAYVIEVLALNFLNIFCTLLLGAFLGVLPGVATCLVVAVLFRHSAGGAHSNSPLRCAAVTVVIFPLLALLGAYFSRLNQGFVDILSAVAFVVGITAMIILAPVDSPAAPITSPLRRKKLKYISITFVVLVTAAAMWFRDSQWQYAEIARACISLTLLWTSFTLTVWGHKLMSIIDTISFKK
ncbi:accessory gene regulator ArgB-like protein [Desulfoscipio gibsoniae]|uniref:Protein possibly involved in post-translational modification of quorum-sensing peptides n=1 Tax=Desulfoscipio gibsoniae DSM 7213 TaxID=767817 RepID=R4KFQ0_9FIRM|nr:accessory gene regulator B family protein [Desulfoscipio gibsoniae]AGL00487.1 protein possibly involved in post-translational modification of quorum-sensing peptides [Desulfoscipio gibsoniae DSM 7213]